MPNGEVSRVPHHRPFRTCILATTKTCHDQRPFSLPNPPPRQTAVPQPTRPIPQNLPNQPAAQLPNPLPLPNRLTKNVRTKPAGQSPNKTCAAAQTLTSQPASTFGRLANTATRRKMTQNARLNRVGFCFPKLTPCQNAQRKAGFCCPSPLPFSKTSKCVYHESQPAFWKRTETQTLKNRLVADRLTK